MICGYEWGYSKSDSAADLRGDAPIDRPVPITFSNKVPRFGPIADTWPYDKRIKTWFRIWGNELNTEQSQRFDRCIVQTNWCNTQGHHILGGIKEKLATNENVENFISRVSQLKPRLILFFGNQMIRVLQQPHLLNRIKEVCGPIVEPLEFPKVQFAGKRFKVGFQSFESCKIVSLPHPSSSRGLTNDYISLFTPKIAPLIAEVKRSKACP